MEATMSTDINSAYTKEVIDEAILNHNFGVLALAAKHPDTSVADLERIFDDCDHNSANFLAPEHEVMNALARNEITPPDILTVLAESLNPKVREGVAVNPNTPMEVLGKLTGDHAPSVRHRLATNPNLPNEYLRHLADDPVERVRSQAQEYLGKRTDKEL
jgi:hypothetical protein